MSYEIITYDPDTGADEHGDYRTQKEARQGLKLYRQEAAALIYDLDRWRIVYQRGHWPSGRGTPYREGVQRLIILFILLLPVLIIWETAKKS